MISSLVTIYTPWPADNWNELDIELLRSFDQDAVTVPDGPIRYEEEELPAATPGEGDPIEIEGLSPSQRQVLGHGIVGMID